MPIIKARELAKFGIVTDVDPYDLPLGAWSFGVNARFVNGKVTNAPVWRNVDTLGSANPRYVFSGRASDGTTSLFVGYRTGAVNKWSNGTETAYTLSGYTPADVEAIWTSCFLAGVIYVNRSDRTPWGLVPAATAFTQITDWDSNHSCKLLRSYNSALVALNVTKSGTNYPTLVKTSDIITDPSVMPASWDHTDPSTNAVENPLADMKDEIKDAGVLGNSLIIYGATQNFSMRADGSDDVYAFDQLPYDGGAINANCHVEVDGKHFVFGSSDIYVHDGLTKQSIAQGRVRDFIYGSMNASKASQFFVSYNPNLKQISFNYLGTDEHNAYAPSTGCNRAAVYDVPSGNWMPFDDTPLVFAACVTGITLDAPTWATVTATWATIGGSWQDLEDGSKKAAIYVGEASVAYGLGNTLYAHDPWGANSVVSSAVDEAASQPVFLEREGIDLDELDADLRGYKHIISVYPQGRTEDDTPLEFAFGAADTFGAGTVFSDYQTYEPPTDWKLDYDMQGRYLAMRLRFDNYTSFSLSGIDLDVEVLSDI